MSLFTYRMSVLNIIKIKEFVKTTCEIMSIANTFPTVLIFFEYVH